VNPTQNKTNQINN